MYLTTRGEILGFYGLVGAGRTELAKIIIGEDRLSSGDIYVNGEKVAENKAQGSITLPESNIIVGRNVAPSLPYRSVSRGWT